MKKRIPLPFRLVKKAACESVLMGGFLQLPLKPIDFV